MKVAHLISNYFPNIGGAQVCVHEVANRTVDKGHSAVVITPTPGGRNDGDFKYEILRINPLLNRILFIDYRLGKWYLEKILSRIQKRYCFDLWQVTVGYPLGAASADFFNRNGIPCVLRCAGEDIQVLPELDYGYRLKNDIDARVRADYRRFSALITASEGTKNDYLSIGVPEDNIFIIPNGVDRAEFRSEGDRGATRESLGLKEDEKLIITVGRNHPKKGYRHIPQIIRDLAERGIRFKWLLAGKGCEGIKSLADKAGVGEYVIIREVAAGYKDKGEPQIPDEELIRYYRAADIFLFPTYIELFAKVIIEAMAAGLPIVTTDAPGVNDLIKDGVSGLKCGIGCTDCMAESVSRLFSDKALADKLGENALHESRDYDWSKIADKYLELYEKITRPKAKVAHIITDLDIGGAEMMLLRTLRNFKDNRYEHMVISLHPDKNSLREEIEKEGIKVYSLGLGMMNLPATFAKLLSILKTEKPQIVHNYLFHADILGRIASRLARVPIVISSIRNENIGGRIRELLLNITDFSVDRVTAVSRNVADAHLKRGTTRKQVDVIRNGIELGYHSREDADGIRRDRGVGRDTFLILTVANLEPKKGYTFLFDALSSIKKNGHDFKMLVVGFGKEEKKLRDKIMSLGLSDEVELLGKRRDITGLLAASDLFVLPSLWEGLPNALLEAMAAELPVVATHVGGIPEVVIDGETGLLVAPRDSDGLARAIERVIGDGALRARLAKNARVYAERNFDIKDTVSHLDKLYSGLLKGHGKE